MKKGKLVLEEVLQAADSDFSGDKPDKTLWPLSTTGDIVVTMWIFDWFVPQLVYMFTSIIEL